MSDRRRAVSVVLLGVGLALFNWWLALPWLVPRDGMFDRLISDATATGSQNATAIRLLEAGGASILVLALLLRGPDDAQGRPRLDWWCVVGLVAFEILGAVFVEACQSGTDRACFERELAFDLEWHHYLHIVAGVFEWSFALAAAWFGWRRLRGNARGRVYQALLIYAPVVLAPLALAFFTHRLFAVVEFTIYAAFSLLIALTVTERDVVAEHPAAAS